MSGDERSVAGRPGESAVATALARSQRRATSLTQSFFTGERWDAQRVIDFVNDVGGISVATVSAAGIPHAAFTICGGVDEQIVFTVTPGTILHRNLAANRRIGFTVTTPSHSLMGQGIAERLLTMPADHPAAGIAPLGWVGEVWTVAPTGLVAG